MFVDSILIVMGLVLFAVQLAVLALVALMIVVASGAAVYWASQELRRLVHRQRRGQEVPVRVKGSVRRTL